MSLALIIVNCVNLCAIALSIFSIVINHRVRKKQKALEKEISLKELTNE